jgi:hypothetical protein
MRMKGTAVVAAVVLATMVTHAQRGQPPQQRPSELPLTNPKRVAFEMEDNLGLIRQMQQIDQLKRIEYWGTKGTLELQGKTVTLSKFRVSIDYDVPAMRFDFTHDGQREIQVVADKYAWNEDTPGGKATPMPAAVNDRLLQVWLTPVGLAKAAAKAANDNTAKLSTEAGATVMTYPVSGATAKVTLNKLYQPTRVEAQVGGVAYDASYTDYGDLNDDAPADIFLPRRIVEKRGAATVLDLTVATSNTYNPYVIFPIPDSVANPGGAAR